MQDAENKLQKPPPVIVSDSPVWSGYVLPATGILFKLTLLLVASPQCFL